MEQLTIRSAWLESFGALAVHGADARAFLQAQLTNDVEQLPPDCARRAGWCSAKGRLLASLLIVPQAGGFLLQLARDLAPAVSKRLAMFVLRAKVNIADVSPVTAQLGVWGAGAGERLAACGLAVPEGDLALARAGDPVAVRVGTERYLLLGPGSALASLEAELALPVSNDNEWMLAEIRAGYPLIVRATQDMFVPQMVNLEALGVVDFKKGCYPGQEIVARTQYRGQLKRRMVRARGPVGVFLAPAQDLYSDDLPGQASGTVVSAASVDGASEVLAVVPVGAAAEGHPVRLAPRGAALELLDLPYPT